jgi:hypothetical protein
MIFDGGNFTFDVMLFTVFTAKLQKNIVICKAIFIDLRETAKIFSRFFHISLIISEKKKCTLQPFAENHPTFLRTFVVENSKIFRKSFELSNQTKKAIFGEAKVKNKKFNSRNSQAKKQEKAQQRYKTPKNNKPFIHLSLYVSNIFLCAKGVIFFRGNPLLLILFSSKKKRLLF